MKAYLVAYDLADAALRRRVALRLQRDGRRVQESVFEVYVRTDAGFERLCRDLQALLGAEVEGQLRWYGLNRDGYARAGAIGSEAPAMPAAVVVR